ncbi:MAG: hypothetical protein NVSMB9_00230 [Isosphaeraceae bacterium]
MISGSPRVLGIVAIATCVVHCLLLGAAPPEKSSEPLKVANLVLFDGKSLDGWKQTDFFHAGKVYVEDGTIVMPVGGPMSGITCTRKDLPLSNYQFTYEALRRKGNDFFAAATFPVGKSFVTLVNGGWGGSITGLSSLNGADASENETSRFVKYQDRVWYRFKVRVTDQVIRCWVDDKEVVAVNHEGRQVGTRIESRANQPLGFATWNTSGALRKVELRALSDAEIADTNSLPQ